MVRRVAGQMDDVIASVDGHVAASKRVLHRVGRVLLCPAEVCGASSEVDDRRVKRAAESWVCHLSACCVNGGELIEQLHILPGRDVNAAAAGANHLVKATHCQ